MRDQIKDVTVEILVLGIGNLLMSDDAVGLRVAENLERKEWPPEVAVLEVGTSVFSYLEIISRSRHVIAVDALRAGGKPGSIYRLAEEDILCRQDCWRDMHGFSLPEAIQLARKITGFPRGFIVYGVEPQEFVLGISLSPPVERSIHLLVNLIECEIKSLLEQT